MISAENGLKPKHEPIIPPHHISGLINLDPETFNTVGSTAIPKLAGVFSRRGIPEDEAFSYANQAFAKFFTHIQNGNPIDPYNLDGYLIRTGLNCRINDKRYEEKRKAITNFTDAGVYDDNGGERLFAPRSFDVGHSPVEKVVLYRETLQEILRLLSKMPAPVTAAVRLYYAGYNPEEIAEIQGCSPQLARVRLFRGRERIREKIENQAA